VVPIEKIKSFSRNFVKNWLCVIHLDWRQEERNDDEISYCRSIDRSFGRIEKNIMFLLFSICLYGSNTLIGRTSEWTIFFSSPLFSPFCFSLSLRQNRSMHTYKHTHTHRKKTTTKDLFIIIFLLLFVLLATCRFQ
jgi:hypothetical protein